MQKLILLLGLFLLLTACAETDPAVTADLTIKKWQKVSLDFAGPKSSETAADNPFVNYRLDVTFRNGEREMTVPGFYAADGNAAESSADAGNVWRVHFRPDEVGEWTWEATLHHGDQVVYDPQKGERIELEGGVGTLLVQPAAAGEKGRLVRNHPRYLTWAETGQAFLKGGADSPENLLGYYEFDGTYRHSNEFREGEAKTEGLHEFASHAGDFTDGPTWQDGKGKNLMGALSYLAGLGVNSFYALTLNINGDGKDVWPFVDHETFDRFDVSKLAQWERLFDHADDLGMMIHLVLQETENENLLDGGDTGPQRQLYFRELVARFGHHPAVMWNLGEENGPNDWSDNYQTTAQQEAMIDWFAANDPYQNYVVLHTHPGAEAFAKIYEPLLGNGNLGGLSMQLGNGYIAHEQTKLWIERSREAGAPWIITLDEVGPWYRGLDPDTGYTPHPENNNQDSLRALTLWGNLMAGGAGVEWYFGAKNENNDLNAEDWRSRERAWKWTAAAIQFFQQHVPFAEMENHDELLTAGAYCLANNDTYLVYLPFGQTTKLDLTQATGAFTLRWYAGETGAHAEGNDQPLTGGQMAVLTPPGDGDWAGLLTRN
ncbi:MAG: DUF5060 domain-containing protein [Bacteroidota bacterium]